MPADGVPYVGRHDPLSPNLWVATGFKKWGLAMGTAAAELLAARIAGREHRLGRSCSTRTGSAAGGRADVRQGERERGVPLRRATGC